MLPGWRLQSGCARPSCAIRTFGNASIVNESSGSVETKGTRAFGIFAGIGSSDSGTAMVRNKGSVTTTGNNADGVSVFASRRGNDPPIRTGWRPTTRPGRLSLLTQTVQGA